MKEYELPLQKLFTDLQDAEIPLGVDEYQLVLRGLQAGFGLPDKDALKRLCKAVWIKSLADQAIFDRYFEENLGYDSKLEQVHAASSDKLTSSQERGKANSKFLSLISYYFGNTIRVAIVIALCIIISPSCRSKIDNNLDTPSSLPPPDISPVLDNVQKMILPDLERWKWWDILITVLIVSGTVLIAREILLSLTKQQKKSNLQDLENKALNHLSSENIQTLQDEVLTAQVQQALDSKLNSGTSYDIKQSDYFPISTRQLKQSWRYLRRSIREGPPSELDIEATVEEVSRHGMLLKTIMVPPRVNKTELLLLMDHDGSMVSFHSLAQRLAETAILSGKLGKAGTYYFHNCPVRNLFHDPLFQEPEPIEDFLKDTCSSQTRVLIFSDGGAARGGFNLERLQLTACFLKKLKYQVKYAVWLNPFPQERWAQTTAASIAELIPMFAINRQGFQSSINVLRGKYPKRLK